MAIPISKYIDISTTAANDVVGSRDFSGLVFSKVAMKTTVDSAYTDIKSDYEAGNVVQLSYAGISACFSDTTFISEMQKYFSYTGGTKKPTVLNLALVGPTGSTSETADAAYARVCNGFQNFGAFYFYGSAFTAALLKTTASTNNGNIYGHVMVVGTTKANQATDITNGGFSGQMLTHVTHAPIAALAWYAAVDYDQAGASGTIDYKQFSGETATITDESGKTTADALKVNYIGLVQSYGNNFSFYQKGVNMNGQDLGSIRDACWLNGVIVSGYFNLQNSVQKIPANYVGAAMVKNIVVSAATSAIENGVILSDKSLTETQIAEIESYTTDEGAADAVQASGYYASAKIVQSGSDYICQYTLIYAKGDHIAVVNGSHILV